MKHIQIKSFILIKKTISVNEEAVYSKKNFHSIISMKINKKSVEDKTLDPVAILVFSEFLPIDTINGNVGNGHW